ncbi:MAG: hypothetical protein GWN67_29260 [Phycisphaerae bacterium]|nr:hypothetical protein [Phycisphaerae bacterium]NIR62680.1 hypothetical protein [candidate division Zixibacteria bacterium]NIP51994.1 hypothetical protein [Phycisphaerae bacterium]NIS54819.1 hypothetical protein [Phycisphaerae bacterium]NIU10754.1 hypothetical protein [Phycisphaerae bacterium]
MKYATLIVATLVFISSVTTAEIIVPEGFVVEKLLDQIDGQTPRLEAISNPAYGVGVVSASMDNGILKVLKISDGTIETLSTKSGYPTSDSVVLTVRFDRTGVFSNKLFVSVRHSLSCGGDNGKRTDIIEISPDGDTEIILSEGTCEDWLTFNFEFTPSEHGYQPGIYLYDRHITDGTPLYHLDSAFNLTELHEDLVPPGRSDIDIRGLQYDSTGIYDYRLIIADSDDNNDDKTVIYQLLPDLSFVELTTPVSTSQRYYGDICISPGGSFGQIIYVTDKETDSVMTVDPNGIHDVFGYGFEEIESITVDEQGRYLYVSDLHGVYRIRADSMIPGPLLVMREPWVENDDVHTGEKGVDDLRLLWSEPVLFSNADVTVENEDSNSIPFSVSGSGSQFMIIAFGEKLLNDKYTLTITESVVSSATGYAIDGDNDGIAGGDAILNMEHRERHDSDNDNDIDFCDLADFANKWLWMVELP